MVTIFNAASLPKINVRFYVYIYSSQLLVKCVENNISIFINIVCFSFNIYHPKSLILIPRGQKHVHIGAMLMQKNNVGDFNSSVDTLQQH